MELKPLDEYRWEIPAREGMRAPGRIWASAAMLERIRADNALEQVANVAWLPGIVGASLAMPDIHWGYGFPIGGVAAMDPEEGVISPGGVGYDINCGVRVVATGLAFAEVRERLAGLVDGLFRDVPCGVGQGGELTLARRELERVLRQGARWMVEQGWGSEADLERCEENGCLAGADPARVSDRACKRGADQLGTLGSGNHFIELQQVERVFDPAAAAAFGLAEGQLLLFIHSGSRGLGHQVCEDYLEIMNREAAHSRLNLPDRQLACAPIRSEAGRGYIAAMSAAANYAWANRQMLMHLAVKSIQATLKVSASTLRARLVYDIGHNNAKLERHRVGGREREVWVHRKGATRSFGPGRPEVPADCRAVGQPVLVPGSMGTASWILAGTQKAMDESFGSCCHGAGRLMSRKQAIRQSAGRHLARELEARGIRVLSRERNTLAEEMPEAYKDVDEVVRVVHASGLGRKVARMLPVGVVKG
ncbi:RtcB family protein [bacterium]|nr:RtcB family protein [bacterium]